MPATGVCVFDAPFAAMTDDDLLRYSRHLMLDETAEGNLFAALRTREADLEKHLQSGQGAEVKDDVREKAREEARKKFEADQAKAQTPKPPPEFGSAEDFQLAQALNRLKGKPVLVSKTAVERKPEAETVN